LRRWPRKMIEDYREDSSGRELGRDYRLKVVQESLLEAYPVLKNIAQHPSVWAKLMFLESEAVISTMLRLKREYSVPSYSVHDSLIVQKSNLDLAKEVLAEEYFKATNVQPKLEAI
jgi:hypothetical protein